MKLLNTWFALILIASALLLSAESVNASEPSQRTIPQNQREATAKQKPAHERADPAKSDRRYADALTITTPSRPTESESSADPTSDVADEERHWSVEEAHEARALQVEENLVCLTAGLALINALVMAIYFVTMLASIRATKAAKQSADAAKHSADTAEFAFYTTTRPWVLVSDLEIGPSNSGPIVTYKVYNTGPSPALFHGLQIVGHVSSIDPDRYDKSLDVLVMTRAVAIHVPPHTSAKEGYLTRCFTPSLTQMDRDDIRSGKKWLYVYGRVTYLGPLNEIYFYYTGFGSWHQGEWSSINAKMQPMISTKINYFK
jgi:hypothetical protein